MNRFLDDALVAIVLAASVSYALLSLGPKPLRRLLRTALADLAARAPARMHLGAIERRLRDAIGSAGACGGCGSCAADPKDTSAGGSERAPSEIRVRVAEIGKRRPG
jgi:hypothetical protein